MKFKKSHIVLSWLFLLVASVFSQTKFINQFYYNDISQKYLIERWSTDNGLPQNSVNDITQTSDGFLWFATEEGVVRFDGTSFIYFNISNTPGLKFNRIRAIKADKNGGLWIGGEVGGIAYLKDKVATDYAPKLPGYIGRVYDIDITDNGDVWIGSERYIIKFDGKSFQIIKKPKNNYFVSFHLIVFDGSRVLFSTSEGLFQTDSTGTVTLLSKNAAESSMRRLSENEILIGQLNQLKVFSLKTNRIIKNITKKRFANSYEKLLVDSKNNIWWGSIDFGLHVILPDGSDIQFENPILDKGYVNVLFEDETGNIWIGTGAYGVFKLSRRYFYSISLFNGVFNDIINQIYQRRDGSVWVGSNCGGVAEIQGSKVTYFFDGLSNIEKSCIWSIIETSDLSMYLGTFNYGIYKFKTHPNKSKTLPGSVSALSFLEDGDSVWAAGNYGLHVIKNDTVYLFKSENFPDNTWFNTLVKDKNDLLWLGGRKGLFRFTGKDFEAVQLLPNNKDVSVRPIYFDENNRMFVGSYGQGLFVEDSGKFVNIKKSDGLFDNTIHTIFEDNRHNLWMTSNHGIFVVKKEDIFSHLKNRSDKIDSKIFTKKLGFPSSEFNGVAQPAHLYLKDGTLLLPSMEGIVAVDVNNIELNENPPKVLVDEFLIDGKKQNIKKNILAPAGYSDIEIRFAAIDFTGVEKIQYKYKIEGLDKMWSRPTFDKKIILKSIPPGEYRFKVSAKRGFSSWSQPAELKFKIEPKFYQTSIFKIFFIFLALVFSVGAATLYINIQNKISRRLAETVKQRTKELQVEISKKEKVLRELKVAKEEEERQRKLAEKLNRDKTEMLRIISHNLKNPIGVIRSSASMINNESSEGSVEKELSDIIFKASEEALNGIDEILHHSEVEDLEFKLSLSEFDFIELVKDVIDKNIQIAKNKNQEILFNDYPNKKELITADREKLGLAIDNYVSNAIKYSPLGEKIVLKVGEKEDKIYFSVIDQGPGISEEDKKELFGKFKKLSARPTANETSSGLGLSIVKRIIELHSGEVGVFSNGKGKGSEFYFLIPKSPD